MKYELHAPIYILFAELANFEVDVDQRLDLFLKENIKPDKGISKKYILDILEQALLDNEALNVKLVRKEVVIRNCLSWIKRNREENTIDAEMTALTPEAINSENQTPWLFKNYEVEKLFKKWKGQCLNPGEEKAGLCFIYHQMTNDGLMHEVGVRKYKDWLIQNFGFDFGDYWKSFNEVKGGRKELNYKLAKD